MANALTLFDKNDLQSPAHLQDLNDEGNINDRISVPSLSYEGKVWSIMLSGEKTQLVKRDAEGDEVPLAVMRVVVLDYNQRRGRSFYEGAYDPSNAGRPVCFSDDGIKPHASIAEPQCDTCEKCPMAVKGSRVSENGKAVTACSQHRIVAVVPAHKMDMEPLRLKLAVTSDYDKENELEAKGWYAFQQYRDFLKARNINHTAMIVTKMRFDPGVAYPKVLFSPDRWVEPEEKKIINPAVKSQEVADLLSGVTMNPTPAGGDGKSEGDEDDGAAEKAAAAKAKKEKAEADAKAEAEKAKRAEAAKKAAATKKAKAEAEAKAKADALDDDDDGEIVIPSSKSQIVSDDDDDLEPRKAKKTADDDDDDVVSTDIPDDVNALLADWDDD